MGSETLLYIILAGIIALLLALFQYFKNRKSMSKLYMLFLFLRLISVFAVLLLIINPSFKHLSLSIEKPNLVIAVDNSSSVKHLNNDAKTLDLINKLKADNKLKGKFDIDIYTFGKNLKLSDSITFTEDQTNISAALKELSQVYKKEVSPIVLITDGNQTFGNDYQFTTKDYSQAIFPIILGDTITYTDLKIQQLNVNKYAFLKNKFPVEVILVYNGNEAVKTRFEVVNGNQILYTKPVSFSKQNNSEIINFTLPANQVGIANLKATVVPLNNEKNKVNNTKNFGVEVINQKTKIAIVSDMVHPDIGALKKSIEHNEQRFVEVIKVNDMIFKIDDFQLFIMYQPNNKFNSLFEVLKSRNSNIFSVVGTKTDLNFLNRISNNYSFDITNQTENYQAELNRNYSPFIIEDIDFESFPPLLSNYGEIKFSEPYESILNKTLNGVTTELPLLVSLDKEGRREVVLFGENIWQWRAQSYLNDKSFSKFDDFIGKLIQYLASNKQKNRLNLDFESFYDGYNDVIIKAEFFDKNYVFDNRETLNITVINKESKTENTFPMLLKGNNYQVDLSSLPPSEYSFTIKTTKENLSKSGDFQILDYNVEQQFLNADLTKLEQVATNSAGNAYFIADTSSLINDLLNDNRFTAVQKSTKNNIPLIDWKYLLGIIALSLGLEWFLRKYNGLI